MEGTSELPEEAEPSSEWFVYLLACADGSLYCGVTTDPARREGEHRQGRGARYTRSRRVLGMVWLCGVGGRSDALRLEIAVKRQTAATKRLLASGVRAAPSRR